MKRLFKIGVLLLFMIGMFTVQTSSIEPVLVDNDVGVEFTNNVDVSDEVTITNIFVMPGQVVLPLKYLILDKNYVVTLRVDPLSGQEIYFEALNRPLVTQDVHLTTEIMLINPTIQITDRKFISGNIITGLSRLDIGELVLQNPIC